MTEYLLALAEHYRASAAEGCYQCGQSITPTNPRRDAWCAACEMQELEPKRRSVHEER